MIYIDKLPIYQALYFYYEQSKAQAIFLKLEDSVAVMINGDNGMTIGEITYDEMPEFIKKLGDRTIEIIAVRDGNGKYQIPDINRLKYELSAFEDT